LNRGEKTTQPTPLGAQIAYVKIYSQNVERTNTGKKKGGKNTPQWAQKSETEAVEESGEGFRSTEEVIEQAREKQNWVQKGGRGSALLQLW